MNDIYAYIHQQCIICLAFIVSGVKRFSVCVLIFTADRTGISVWLDKHKTHTGRNVSLGCALVSGVCRHSQTM